MARSTDFISGSRIVDSGLQSNVSVVGMVWREYGGRGGGERWQNGSCSAVRGPVYLQGLVVVVVVVVVMVCGAHT